MSYWAPLSYSLLTCLMLAGENLASIEVMKFQLGTFPTSFKSLKYLMVLVGLTVLTGTTKISPELGLGIVGCHNFFCLLGVFWFCFWWGVLFYFLVVVVEGILASHNHLLLISDVIAKLVQQLLKMKT